MVRIIDRAKDTLQDIKHADQAREGIPGEHWMVLAAGVGVWLVSRKSSSAAVRAAGLLAASALTARAASGRDGLSKLLRMPPVGRRIRRF